MNGPKKKLTIEFKTFLRMNVTTSLHNNLNMTKDKVAQKIKEIYTTPSGQSFIIHLVRSFLPINKKSKYSWDLEKCRCCITNQKLVGKEELFNNFLKRAQDIDKNKVEESFKNEVIGQETEFQIDRTINNSVVGIISDRTDKRISLVALEELQKFVEAHKSDKKLSFALSDEAMIEKFNRHTKPSTVKLGDFQALIDLKNRLK